MLEINLCSDLWLNSWKSRDLPRWVMSLKGMKDNTVSFPLISRRSVHLPVFLVEVFSNQPQFRTRYSFWGGVIQISRKEQTNCPNFFNRADQYFSEESWVWFIRITSYIIREIRDDLTVCALLKVMLFLFSLPLFWEHRVMNFVKIGVI